MNEFQFRAFKPSDTAKPSLHSAIHRNCIGLQTAHKPAVVLIPNPQLGTLAAKLVLR